MEKPKTKNVKKESVKRGNESSHIFEQFLAQCGTVSAPVGEKENEKERVRDEEN